MLAMSSFTFRKTTPATALEFFHHNGERQNQAKHIGMPAPSVEQVVYKTLLKSSICF